MGVLLVGVLMGGVVLVGVVFTGVVWLQILDAMNQDSGIPLTQLQVDGGMTSNRLLMQLQADILCIPVGEISSRLFLSSPPLKRLKLNHFLKMTAVDTWEWSGLCCPLLVRGGTACQNEPVGFHSSTFCPHQTLNLQTFACLLEVNVGCSVPQ